MVCMANSSENKNISCTWKFYSVNKILRGKSQYKAQNLQESVQFFPSLIIHRDSHQLLPNTKAEHLMFLMEVK